MTNLKKTKQKRFIAGANCPKCNETDSLVLYSHDQSIECVSCNFVQTTAQREQEASKDLNKETKASRSKLGDITITRVE